MRTALTALSLSMLLPSLSVSIANVGLPDIASSLDATFTEVQWVVIAYLLAVTSLVVGAGGLGDRLGRRRLLTAGIALFTAGSLLCGLAPTLPVLLAARALQGAGAAAMMALTMAFVGTVTPKDRTGRAMGLLGTMSAVGTALGPSLGGALITAFGWRAVFLACVPLGLLALALTRTLPDSPRANAPFTTVGTALLALTLGSYALAVTVHPAILIATAVALVATSRTSLVDFSLFRDPALATTALVSTVVMTTLVVGPFHLARALHLDPVTIGLTMSTGPAVAALTGVPAGRATDRYGSRTMVGVGLAGVVLGCLALAVMPSEAGVLGYVVPLVTLTASYALFQAANNTAVMATAPADRRGVVSAALTLSRNLGLMTGAAAMGALFAVAAGAPDITMASPDAIARGTHWTFAVAALLTAVGLGLHYAARDRLSFNR